MDFFVDERRLILGVCKPSSERRLVPSTEDDIFFFGVSNEDKCTGWFDWAGDFDFIAKLLVLILNLGHYYFIIKTTQYKTNDCQKGEGLNRGEFFILTSKLFFFDRD